MPRLPCGDSVCNDPVSGPSFSAKRSCLTLLNRKVGETRHESGLAAKSGRARRLVGVNITACAAPAAKPGIVCGRRGSASRRPLRSTHTKCVHSAALHRRRAAAAPGAASQRLVVGLFSLQWTRQPTLPADLDTCIHWARALLRVCHGCCQHTTHKAWWCSVPCCELLLHDAASFLFPQPGQLPAV